MTLQEYNDLYKMPLLKSMTITTSGGITITNANIVSENMSLEKSLCSENNLRYGRCEAACFTIRIADLNHDFTGEWLNVIQDVVTDSEGYLLTQNNQYLLTEDGYRIKLKDEEIGEATAPYGRFKVYSDKPENDRRWRVLTCYDQMFDILNADVLAWYNTLTFPMTIKNLRDSFFSYLGITQVAKTLVNDNFSTPGGFAVSGELSGKTVIESICELNGVFGQMTADGKFDYVSLTDAEELTVDYYVDGTGSYEDYVTDVITGINIKGTSNDVGITVGTTDNLYVISSNPLVYGTEGTTALTDALTALLNHISSDSFRPFKVTTYGNPMLPLGTKVTLNTKNKTIVSYVIKKNLTGIQSLKDEVSATGDKHQATNVNSPKSEIFRTQGKVHELEINVDGLTSRVSATETNLQNNYSTTQQMNSAITQSAENITTQVSNTYVTQSAYNAEVQNLQDQIDGRIEYFDGNVVPTLNNPPANSWTTTSAKDSHVGDLYRYHYTQSGVERTDYYRFDKNTSTTPATYSWVALGESEVDEALRQAELANQKADAAQAQLDSLQQNVEDNYYTKTQTNSAINQSASSITQTVSSTYETKSDSTSKFNTANTNAQGYANDAQNAANAATDTKLQNYYTKTETNSQIQQTADSITQTVSTTYTTKTDFNNLSIGGRNLFKQTTDDWKSRILLGNDNESFTLNGDGISVTDDNVCDAVALGLKENDIIQISFDIKFSSDFAPVSGQSQRQYIQGSCNYGGSWSGITITDGGRESDLLNIIYSDSREGHINTFFKVPGKMVDGTTTGKFYLNIRFNYWTGTVYLKNVMIEKASKPSEWSPAPEDGKAYTDDMGASTLATANENAQGYASEAYTNAKNYTDSIEISGKNILYNSDGYSNGFNATTYPIADFPFTEQLIEGEEYIITAKIYTSSDKKALAFYHSGGSVPLTNWKPISSDGLYSFIFTATQAQASQTGSEFGYGFCRIYVSNNPNAGQGSTAVTGTARVDWIQIERGNKATPWSLSTQDAISRNGKNIFSIFRDAGLNSNKFRTFNESGEYTLANYQSTGSFTQFANLTYSLENLLGVPLRLSFDAISPNGSTQLKVYNKNNNPRYEIGWNNSNEVTCSPDLSTSWKHYSVNLRIRDNGNTKSIPESNKIEFYAPSKMGVKIRNVKLEIGTIETQYAVAPEDNGSFSEIKLTSEKIVMKVYNGRLVTVALSADPSTGSSFSVKADDISFISNGNITLATGSTGRIGIDSTNFKVNKDTGNVSVTGSITATSLTLSGSASVPSSKVSGLATVATTGKASDVSGLATVATSGKASDVSGLASVATTGSYDSLSGKPDLTVYVAKDGTIGTVEEGSTGFVVSSQGLLQASNAIIYGTIFAGAGTIGGWNIESNRILSTYTSGNDTYTIRLNRYDDTIGSDKNAIEIRTAVGGTTTYPFAVKYDGRLIARQATIEGTVTSANLTATGGTIGGFEIDSTFGLTMKSSRNNTYSGIRGTSDSLWTIFAKAPSLTRLNSATFRVGYDGVTFCPTLCVTNDSGNSVEISDKSLVRLDSSETYGGMLRTYNTTGGGILYSTASRALFVHGDFTALGTKSRTVQTSDYGMRSLYCYETPSPMFGDVGEGKIAEDGKCYVWLDSTFSETIKTDSYQVFLQKYGKGECYVTERTKRYFVVEGTEGMPFGWEIKAKQADYENLRLENFQEDELFIHSLDYGEKAIEHIINLNDEREVA